MGLKKLKIGQTEIISEVKKGKQTLHMGQDAKKLKQAGFNVKGSDVTVDVVESDSDSIHGTAHIKFKYENDFLEANCDTRYESGHWSLTNESRIKLGDEESEIEHLKYDITNFFHKLPRGDFKNQIEKEILAPKNKEELKTLLESLKEKLKVGAIKLIAENSWLDKVFNIVKEQQAEKIDGVLCDYTTATLMKSIYENLSDQSKTNFENMKFSKAANLAWKLSEKLK
jgi:hypothetical protein